MGDLDALLCFSSVRSPGYICWWVALGNWILSLERSKGLISMNARKVAIDVEHAPA